MPPCVMLGMARAQALRLRVEVVLVAAAPGVHEPGAGGFRGVVEPLLGAHLASSGSRFEHAEGLPRLFHDGQADRRGVSAAARVLLLLRANPVIVVAVVESGVPAGGHATVLLLGQANVTDSVRDERHGVDPGPDLVPLAAGDAAGAPISPRGNITFPITGLHLPPPPNLPLRTRQSPSSWPPQQSRLRCCCQGPAGAAACCHPSTRLWCSGGPDAPRPLLALACLHQIR